MKGDINNRDRKIQGLFYETSKQLSSVVDKTKDAIICPLCGTSFGFESLNKDLSIEHVPPRATARLIGERSLTTITCARCNNHYGSELQGHLKAFLIFQLHQSGKYEKPLRGTMQMQDPSLVPLRANIVFTQDKVQVVGVPKANNIQDTQKHSQALNDLVHSQTKDWQFNVTLNYGFVLSKAWQALLHSAYLAAHIISGCSYAFTPAGTKLRELIAKDETAQLGPCVIVPQTIGVGGNQWIARINMPLDLRSLWVKVAGNIVILPMPSDDGLQCYNAWQRVSSITNFGLSPRIENLNITFFSERDGLEAQKCLPRFFAHARPKGFESI
ncbi:MAG: hypothetical protein P3T54_01595 [Dehalogenimonas sp.]|uniref:HNH endonuclease 5 domain-containing protein n=1 Tax=Candidatus Dehalogenimonas loeffleri TaxID=3127115 RepID=A0ABZ2JCP0_9CHLR|nr:hypothetical protein [Dehalogenimonas sp.]